MPGRSLNDNSSPKRHDPVPTEDSRRQTRTAARAGHAACRGEVADAGGDAGARVGNWKVERNSRSLNHTQNGELRRVAVDSTAFPTSWRLVRLGDVAKTSSGGTPSRTRPDFYGGSILWVKSGELRDGVVYATEETITDQGLASSSAKIFPKGTVCIALYGATVGRLGILGTNAATNQAVCGIFPTPDLDPRYLYRFLESKRNDLIHQGKGGAQSNISQEIVREIKLPLPGIAEQQRIVLEIEKQFTRLDAAVIALRRARANLKKYRAAVLNAACEGTTQGTVRDGWSSMTLDHLCEVFVDSAHRTPKYTAVGPYALGPRDVVNGALNLAEARHVSEAEFAIQTKRRIPQTGDIVYSRELSLGWAVEIPEGVRVCLSQGMCLFRPLTNILSTYLLPVLNGPVGRRQALAAATGSAHPHINLRDIRSYRIPVPPLAEQYRLVNEFERRLSVIDELERLLAANLQRAARLRQSILERAFSGRLVKSDVTDKLAGKIKERSPTSRRHFLRAVLSAEIVHQLHAEPTFGQIKHQKIFHLCEHIAEITDLDVQYHRDAAGPYDNRLIYANEAELKRQKWYESYSRKKVGHGYRPLAKAGGHEKYLERYWPEKLETIRRLIRLMRRWDTERCEIFSTAYAAWNDLLLWGREVTDDVIVHEVLHRWHESKQRIPKERWRKALEWMRKEGFVPTGFGKPTAAASS